MVEFCYVSFKSCAEEIADKRHKSLKSAEPETCNHHLLYARFFNGKTLADCNRKRVHRKTDCDNKKFKYCHNFSPYKIKIGYCCTRDLTHFIICRSGLSTLTYSFGVSDKTKLNKLINVI